MKTCINCGGTGPFGPNKNAKDGLKSNCRKCLAEKQRAYAAAHPEAWANWATANADHLKAKDAARYRADPEGEKARVRAYRDKNPEKARVWGQISKFRRYNLTPEDVNVLFTKQGGKCAICPVPLVPGRKGMVVDHDHETGLVRGLLCSLCNMMLGDLRETPAFFDRAIAYLLEGPVMGLSPQKRPPGVGYASNGTRAGNLWYFYGLTERTFQELLTKQGRRCGICHEPFGKGQMPHIDHVHDLGKKLGLRGLLCRSCNLGLGHARESVQILWSAIEYLTLVDHGVTVLSL